MDAAITLQCGMNTTREIAIAAKGCLYTIAAIVGLTVAMEASWTFHSPPLAIVLGLATAIGLGWFLSDRDEGESNSKK